MCEHKHTRKYIFEYLNIFLPVDLYLAKYDFARVRFLINSKKHSINHLEVKFRIRILNIALIP
jgi:hypothetical protein